MRSIKESSQVKTIFQEYKDLAYLPVRTLATNERMLEILENAMNEGNDELIEAINNIEDLIVQDSENLADSHLFQVEDSSSMPVVLRERCEVDDQVREFLRKHCSRFSSSEVDLSLLVSDWLHAIELVATGKILIIGQESAGKTRFINELTENSIEYVIFLGHDHLNKIPNSEIFWDKQVELQRYVRNIFQWRQIEKQEKCCQILTSWLNHRFSYSRYSSSEVDLSLAGQGFNESNCTSLVSDWLYLASKSRVEWISDFYREIETEKLISNFSMLINSKPYCVNPSILLSKRSTLIEEYRALANLKYRTLEESERMLQILEDAINNGDDELVDIINRIEDEILESIELTDQEEYACKPYGEKIQTFLLWLPSNMSIFDNQLALIDNIDNSGNRLKFPYVFYKKFREIIEKSLANQESFKETSFPKRLSINNAFYKYITRINSSSKKDHNRSNMMLFVQKSRDNKTKESVLGNTWNDLYGSYSSIKVSQILSEQGLCESSCTSDSDWLYIQATEIASRLATRLMQLDFSVLSRKNNAIINSQYVILMMCYQEKIKHQLDNIAEDFTYLLDISDNEKWRCGNKNAREDNFCRNSSPQIYEDLTLAIIRNFHDDAIREKIYALFRNIQTLTDMPNRDSAAHEKVSD